MSKFRIHTFAFEFWEGPPPLLVQEQGSAFTRPGADGVGQQKLGKWCESFEATLTGWAASYGDALRAIPQLLGLVRVGHVRVIYNDVDYETVFQHRYFVDAVHPVNCQSVVRQYGPSINRTNAGELVVRFVLTPFSLV